MSYFESLIFISLSVYEVVKERAMTRRSPRFGAKHVRSPSQLERPDRH
jgi:hypothetical protein